MTREMLLRANGPKAMPLMVTVRSFFLPVTPTTIVSSASVPRSTIAVTPGVHGSASRPAVGVPVPGTGLGSGPGSGPGSGVGPGPGPGSGAGELLDDL